MFVKTVCKPGSQICVVPVGLCATIQYNAKGAVEKIFTGYDTNRVPIPKKVLSTIVHSGIIPNSLSVKGGTTWIEGVFYTSKSFNSSGTLPECCYLEIIEDIADDPDSYVFYAGRVDSLAAAFNSVVAMRNNLELSGFHLLPIYLIPVNLTTAGFNDLLMKSRPQFKFPLISGYMVFDNGEYTYVPAELIQYTVETCTESTDENGYIKVTVLDDAGITHVYHKSEAITYGIIEKSTVVCEGIKPVYSNTMPVQHANYQMLCPVCGNVFESPKHGPVCCSNSYCPTILYPQIVKFARVLRLPELKSADYVSALSKHKITEFVDILSLPQYKKASVNCTLAEFLKAIVPVDVCTDDTLISKIATVCKNSFKTLDFYLTNPTRLHADIGPVSAAAAHLIEWLSNPNSIRMIEQLAESSQINIVESSKKFDGPAIFRGKTIAITGKFRHGNVFEISSILSSYDGNITVGIQTHADCLVIGDLNENNDGHSVRLASTSGIPVFTESEFFNMYDIDADIAAHTI